MMDLNGHETGNGGYSQGKSTAPRGSSTRQCKRSSDEASKTAKTTPKTRACITSWDKHERYLLTGHAGVRCTGGMTLIRAFVRNLRTGSVMQREKAQVENP